jgi:hypothetical protein
MPSGCADLCRRGLARASKSFLEAPPMRDYIRTGHLSLEQISECWWYGARTKMPSCWHKGGSKIALQTNIMTDLQTAETIRGLEEMRGVALTTRDWDTLEALLGDPLIHIHANGAIEDRPAYMASVRDRLEFLRFERESLDVRCYGNVAIATGILKQTLRLKGATEPFDTRMVTTQVWLGTPSGWMQMSFHATHSQ